VVPDGLLGGVAADLVLAKQFVEDPGQADGRADLLVARGVRRQVAEIADLK
jgi:hypothetical protein